MIEMRRAQLGFGDGLIAEEVSDLREDWMTHADEVLADEEIIAIVYEALAKRHPKSRCRGRRGTPADAVLRLLILKHVRNWSYEVLEREVRANLVYRDFTRIGSGKVPDAKTMGRSAPATGAESNSRADGENSSGQRRGRGTADARGYDGGGNQHSLPDRQHPARRRRSGADPHHEEDHTDCRRGRNQAARPQPQRQVPPAGDRPDRARQGSDQSGQVEAALSLIVEHDKPRGGAGQALLHGSRRRREAGDECVQAGGAGRPAGATR